jgi:UDP-2,3-diacylglucosamine pyrophosphatase LpxH
MQIAVISDLHLGSKDALDRFSRRAEAEANLMGLLRHLERHVDRIVLLGDIFETLRGRWVGARTHLEQLQGVLRAYPEIARRAFEHPRYQLLHGNHDAILARAHRVPDVHRIDADGMRLLFFHGHQLDLVARGEAPISRLVVWLGGWLERIGLRVTAWSDPMHDGGKRTPGMFERAAVALAESSSADVVVTGHTHESARLEIGSTLYMNSGACVAGRRELLLLDTSARRFEVLHDPAFDTKIATV